MHFQTPFTEPMTSSCKRYLDRMVDPLGLIGRADYFAWFARSSLTRLEELAPFQPRKLDWSHRKEHSLRETSTSTCKNQRPWCCISIGCSRHSSRSFRRNLWVFCFHRGPSISIVSRSMCPLISFSRKRRWFPWICGGQRSSCRCRFHYWLRPIEGSKCRSRSKFGSLGQAEVAWKPNLTRCCRFAFYIFPDPLKL